MFVVTPYVQGAAPKEACAEREGTAIAGVNAVGEKQQAGNGTGLGRTTLGSNNDGRKRRTKEEEDRAGRDSRPKLLPGVMVTITPLGAQAILEFNEEVLERRLAPVAVDFEGCCPSVRRCWEIRPFFCVCPPLACLGRSQIHPRRRNPRMPGLNTEVDPKAFLQKSSRLRLLKKVDGTAAPRKFSSRPRA